MAEGKAGQRYLTLLDHRALGIDAIEVKAGLGSAPSEAGDAGTEVDVVARALVHLAMGAEDVRSTQFAVVGELADRCQGARIQRPGPPAFVERQ